MIPPPRNAPAPVLYVANAAKIGGGNRVLMDLMTNLDPSAFYPVLVSPAAGELTTWASRAGIRFHIVPDGDWTGVRPLVRRTAALIRVIMRERPAIVHASAHTCYRALGIAGLLTGTARVCHLGFPPGPGELARAFVSGPDAVIGCYEGQAREFAAEIGRIRPACRVSGIPNGIDAVRFQPVSDPVMSCEIRGNSRHVVAILGHVSEVKGHPTFVEAAAQIAARVPDCAFLAIGGENLQTGLRPALEARGRELGLGNRLRFLGFRRDVERILPAVDVVVLPSSAEGFPIAVLEAMACSKPVVATPVGGVTEAITPDVTGMLVPPRDPDALANAVAALLESPDLSARIGSAARERVERQFSTETFAASVQRIYCELLGLDEALRHSKATGQTGRVVAR